MSILVYSSAKGNAITDSLHVAKGLRVRSLSSRHLLRRLEPANAAAAGFLDEQATYGRTLEQLATACPEPCPLPSPPCCAAASPRPPA